MEENKISLDIEEFIEDNLMSFNSFIEVDGKEKHKATVVRELFNETGSSTDRLRCVRAYTTFFASNDE